MFRDPGSADAPRCSSRWCASPPSWSACRCSPTWSCGATRGPSSTPRERGCRRSASWRGGDRTRRAARRARSGASPGLDYVLVGEADETIPEMGRQLEANAAGPRVRGLGRRNGGIQVGATHKTAYRPKGGEARGISPAGATMILRRVAARSGERPGGQCPGTGFLSPIPSASLRSVSSPASGNPSPGCDSQRHHGGERCASAEARRAPPAAEKAVRIEDQVGVSPGMQPPPVSGASARRNLYTTFPSAVPSKGGRLDRRSRENGAAPEKCARHRPRTTDDTSGPRYDGSSASAGCASSPHPNSIMLRRPCSCARPLNTPAL